MSEVFLPETLKEVFAIRIKTPDAVILAGGTDLFVRMRTEQKRPAGIVGLERISSIRQISKEGQMIRVGAMTTHQNLLDNQIIRTYLPVLYLAVKRLGSPPIRHMGTIGGNICTSSPAGDTLPPLYVLNAVLELASQGGRRMIPIHEFITGPGTTTIRPDEILTSILIPIPDPSISYFRKIGQRQSLAIAIVSMAALIAVDPNGCITDFRCALGSVGPEVMRFLDIESEFIGKRLTYDTLSSAGLMIAEQIRPISDIRASAEYRKMVTERILLGILEGIG